MITATAAKSASIVLWTASRPMVRCYNAAYGATSFNPSPAPMRFRPIYDAGVVVPTAYAGEDGTIALAESVLRDTIVTAGGLLPAARLRGIEIAKLSYPDELSLMQLNGLGLRKLKLSRGGVIDTGPGAYPDTAQLAQALYDAHPEVQGILWTSHQSDHGDALILWETRMDPSQLTIIEGPLALDGPHGLRLVQVVCEDLGVLLEF